MTTTRPTRPFRRFHDDPTDLEAAYFRWTTSDPPASAITERVEHIVRTHLELGAVRRSGTALTRVYRANGEDGLGPTVQIVNDDMPLLVDSVTEALRQLGATVTEVAHPIFDVTRDGGGRLRAIAARRADGAATNDAGAEPWFAESWVHVQLGAADDEQLVERIERELPRVLAELRQVTDDTPAMMATLRSLADPLDPEHAALITWLADGNFTVLGYHGYRFRAGASVVIPEVRPTDGTGLGVLREPGGDDAELSMFRLDGPPVRIANGSVDSALPGSREVYLIGVADYGPAAHGPDGEPERPIVGEHVFLGTFTVTGLHENVLDIPVISRRVRQVIDWAGYELNSFSGQALLEILQSYPRAELFTTDARRLFDTVSAVTNLGARRQVRLFLRPGARGTTLYCLVYLPRDRYSSEVRRRIQDILQAEFDGQRVVYSARVTESDLAIAYFTVHRMSAGPRADISDANRQRVQELIFAATRTWVDRFVAVAAATVEPAVLQDYAAAYPAAYQQDHDPARALADLRRLDRLGDDDIDTYLYRQPDAPAGEWRFALYVAGTGISLSRVMPMLQSLGVEVIDERPYAVALRGGTSRWIYDFGLRVPQGPARTTLDRPSSADQAGADELADSIVHQRISAAVGAMWHDWVEIDGLNELVLRAGLAWRPIAVLRAYAQYLQQAGFAYSFGNITRVLLAHPRLARMFTELFDARFDPDADTAAAADRAAMIAARLRAEIDAVVGLDADRILRALLGLITATLRTNYYRRDEAGNPLEYLSFKLDPAAIAELPKPRPRFEIFVCSPRVAGVHLRFGQVARGGLRWSDRLEDFRTEVLGLVKAQAVKNAVIVPVGAKGGFVVKQPPAPTDDPAADREAAQAEGIACYRTFIRGLLDLTDNIEHGTGAVLAPDRVVRHDGDDPYLVVAADKGTASFSDIANEVAGEYGFWLGDAFASGGSVGYDHKAMGITAKGAWESVRRHFAEQDLDVATQDFTVVGVGDMSGDVFGNGMLLSEHIRLLAAFDHRHIFLDPNPDAAQSFLERTRMFALPRSSWADYDTALISAGGGVYDRSAKAIPVTPEVRAALGLGAAVTSLAPPEMIKAILLAPADLLWNGGIGTYIKSSAETHADVGDKSNDAVRVDANRVRVKAIGEGGNLGITELGRIEFCASGGKCNTDAVDNSAGVDCSDHEVNIKVVLDAAVSGGELAAEERDALLGEMTEEVAELVLRDNISQNIVLGVARANAAPMVGVYGRLIAELEARRGLDRELESLPSDAELAQRAARGRGLTSPELSTLLAHVKLTLKADLLAGELLDSPAFAGRLLSYFPTPLRQRFRATIGKHPLRREIIATMVINDMVDNGGITYAFRLAEEVGASTDDAVRAFVTASEIFDLHSLWHRIRTGPMPTSVRDELELEAKRTLDRASRWLLANRPQPIAIGADIARYRAGVRELSGKVPSWSAPIALDMVRRSHSVVEGGAPRELAEEVFLLIYRYPLLDVLDLADLADRDQAEVMVLYYALDEHLAIEPLLTAVSDLERVDRWQTLARLALRDDLYSSLRALTLDVLAVSDAKESAAEKIAYWESTNRARLARARASLEQIVSVGTHDLATLSVAARQVRGMASGGEATVAAAMVD